MQHSCASCLSSLIGKEDTMSSILIIIILFLFWSVGYFVYDQGVVIHVLLGIALITIGVRIIQERKWRMKLRGKYY